MSRWTAPAEIYLVDSTISRVVAGPFDRSAPVVAIIDRLYHEHGKNYYFGTATRYDLAKLKLFPRNKTGNAALTAAIEHLDLPGLLSPLLGPSSFHRGYEQANWPAIDALLAERGIGRLVS